MKHTALVVSVLAALSSACGPSGSGRVDAGAPADARPGPDAADPADAATSGADASPGSADASPGGDDAAVAIDGMPGTSDLVINEVIKNHDGTNDMEFIEIKGSASTDYSAYTLLVIESDNTPTNNEVGLVDRAYTVGTTDANGYWWTGYLNAQLEGGSITVMLVRDWNGTVATTDIDANDDGTIDVTPWAEVVDDVGFNNTPGTDYIYGVDAGDLRGASRIPDGTDTDQPGDWVQSGPVPGTPSSGEANHTPGAANTVAP